MLSIGCNRKLGRRIGVLNLPRMVTCPGATPLCTVICYAKKANMYKAAVAKRAMNYTRSMQSDFVGALALEIEALRCSRVRFHESGDVYDQTYLDKLYMVCRICKGVEFLMYTKSWHLDWSNRPNNLKVYWSMDKTSPRVAPPGPTAYLLTKGESPPAGAATCVTAKEKHYCGTECVTCWNGTQDVYFNQH